jgi:hypothetical protein
MQDPPFSPQSWLFPSHLFTQFSHDLSPIMLTDILASGISLCCHNTLDMVENIQHVLELRKNLANIFSLGEISDLQCIDFRFVSGSYVNIQSLITSNYRFQQIRFVLIAMQKVRADFVPKLFLITQ